MKIKMNGSGLGLLFLIVWSAASSMAQGIVLDFPAGSLDGSGRTFISHQDSAYFGTYLAMDLPFPPFETLRRNLAAILGKNLKTRHEAHITVVTPPEYESALKPLISMDEIEQIALKAHLQTSQVFPRGVGRGFAVIEGVQAETYFVLVESRNLLEIREQISSLYLARGGDPTLFQPTHFFPHVTLGFTIRDLHESDGVIKDASSRLGEVVLRRVD